MLKTNITLKNALISVLYPAIGIIAYGALNPVFAMGLGDIQVKSLPNQPLLAQVKVTGLTDAISANCFKLKLQNGKKFSQNRVNFTLENVSNGDGFLTITSKKAIKGPMINLSIASVCDIEIQRDYRLQKAGGQLIDADHVPFSANVVAAQSATAASSAAAANTQASEPIAYLSISGANLPVTFASSSGLLLDKKISTLSANLSEEALNNEIDAADEATAINNRLTHLAKQVKTMQKTNQTLLAENAKIETQLAAEKSTKNKLYWLLSLLGLGGLAAGFFVAKKKQAEKQIQTLKEIETILEPLIAKEHIRDTLSEHDGFIDLIQQNIAKKPANLAAANSTQVADVITEKQDVKPENLVSNVAITSANAKNVKPFMIENNQSEAEMLKHANLFLTHGRASLAIQLLQNHLLDFPKQSVAVWLYLLDLIAQEKLAALYEQTALECKEHFNINIPSFSAFSNNAISSKDAPNTHKSLESFPRLTIGLQAEWGMPSVLKYLDDLILNSRLKVRIGFEKEILEELSLLKAIAQEDLQSAVVVQIQDKKIEIQQRREAEIAAKNKKTAELQRQYEKKIKALPSIETIETFEQERNGAFEFSIMETIQEYK
jgi:hypothetical protein